MFRRGSRLASFVLPRPGNRLVESDWIYLHRENIIGMGPRAPAMVGSRGLEWVLQSGLTGPNLSASEHYVIYEPRTIEGIRGKAGANMPYGILMRTERVDARTGLDIFYGMGTMNSTGWADAGMDSKLHGVLEQGAGGVSPYTVYQLNLGSSVAVAGGSNVNATKAISNHYWLGPGRSGAFYTISYDEAGNSYNLSFSPWNIPLTPLYLFASAGINGGPLGSQQTIVTRHSYRFVWMEEDDP